MEKFAIDLDKLLDDLESDDAAPRARGVARDEAAAGDRKSDVRPLVGVDSFVGELIDLSDADFGLAPVLKPSPVVIKPYPTHLAAASAPLLPVGGSSSSSLGGGFVASAAKASAESTKAAWEASLDGFGLAGSAGQSSNGGSYSNGSGGLSYQHGDSGCNGNRETGVLAALTVLPHWPPPAATGTYGHPTTDGHRGGPAQRTRPNEFNPLDSEPWFASSPPPPSSAASPAAGRIGGWPSETAAVAPELPDVPSGGFSRPAAANGSGSSSSVHLWHPAAEAGGGGAGIGGGDGGALPFGTWGETAEGSAASDSTGRFGRRLLHGDDGRDLAPACNETNSLLIANGIVHAGYVLPPPPRALDVPAAVGAGGSRQASGAAAAAAATAGSASASTAAQPDGGAALSSVRPSLLPSVPAVADGGRADAGPRVHGGSGGLLRFDDILVDEHDDDDDALMDAYLAAVPHTAAAILQQQQQPGLVRNALLEANLVSDGLMHGGGSLSGGGGGLLGGDFGSDEEEHVALPTPQENALLQANLVESAMTLVAGRGDGLRPSGQLPVHGGGRETDGSISAELDRGDRIGSSSGKLPPLENGYGWPPATADRHFSNGGQAGSIATMTASAGGMQPVAALATQLGDGGSTKRNGVPGIEQSAYGSTMVGPADAGSPVAIAAGGGSATKETRRPTSLLGLSKVALDSAAGSTAAAAAAGSCNGFAVDSRTMMPLAAALSRCEGEGHEPAAAAAAAAAASQGGGVHAPDAGGNAAADSAEQRAGAGEDSGVDVATVAPSGTREQGEGQEAMPVERRAFANGTDYGEQTGGASSVLHQAAGGDASLAGVGGSADDVAAAWDDLGATKPVWMPDSEAPDCMACNTKFTFTKRRHHCRACGLVYCASCCNMKSRLLYLDFKEARVCSKCHDLLAIGEMRQRELLGQPLTGSVDSHATAGLGSAAIAAVQAAEADDAGAADAAGADAQAALPPVGVLRRSGSRSGQSKTVMFSDGIRPGGDLTHLDGSTDSAAAAAAAVAAAAAAASGGSAEPGHGLHPTRSKKKRSSVGDLIKPRTAFIIPKTGLPPVLFFTDSQSREYVIDENPNSDLLYETMKDQSGDSNFAFVIHKDLHIYVKLVQLNCCAKKLCWCVTSKGLCTVGQEEVAVVLECAPDEKDFPTDLFYFYRMLYEQTFKGIGATELSFAVCTKETLRKPGDGFLGSKEHGGFLFVRPTFQCVQGLPLPPAPYLVAVLLDKWELPWAKVFPLRLALRLGAEYRYYPCPLVSIRGRKPVYGEIGHTIMNLLADFRNYQYTLGRVEGVTVHLQDKVTVISFPKNKYNEIYKILNSSNDYVLALGASFSSDADSHLVCVQTDEGVYQTQAINIQDKPRKVTGASFVVFSGALKTSTPGVVAKSSIVEDGLMVQILPEAMVELKSKIKNMQDHSIKCGAAQQQQGPTADGTEEAVHIKWVDEYKKYNIGVISPIDGFPLDGVESLHVYGYSDLAGSGRRSIRWTEVFFLQNDELGNNPADPVDLSRLAETVAGSCMAAMSPHLETLKESGMVKIGLRVTLGADQVGYEIGSSSNKLPAHILNDLDSELVPVIHSTASTLSSGSLTVFELTFHVLE